MARAASLLTAKLTSLFVASEKRPSPNIPRKNGEVAARTLRWAWIFFPSTQTITSHIWPSLLWSFNSRNMLLSHQSVRSSSSRKAMFEHTVSVFDKTAHAQGLVKRQPALFSYVMLMTLLYYNINSFYPREPFQKCLPVPNKICLSMDFIFWSRRWVIFF